jgi:hypothetical protein
MEELHMSKQPCFFTSEIRKAKEILNCLLFLLTELLTEDKKRTFHILGEEIA